MSIKRHIRRILREEFTIKDIPASVRRRIDLNDDKIKELLKRNILLKYYNGMDINTLIRDVIDYTIDGLEFTNNELYDIGYEPLSKYIKENFSSFILKFIDETFEEEDKTTFCFKKHSERWGGNGFIECFGSWNSLLRGYGRWFPDLNYKEIKRKLDTTDEVLIKQPKDKNSMGYYFTIYKKV